MSIRDIEKYRILESNSLRLKIKDLESAISRCIQSNENITRGDVKYDESFIKNFREKNKNKVTEYENLIKEHSQTVKDIEKGKNDDVIIEKLKKNIDMAVKNNKEKILQKSIAKKEEKIKTTKLFSDEGKSRKIDRDYQYTLRRGEDHFWKAVDTLPERLVENLKTMPHNKGYIWRDVWFFGDLPRENENTIMFEKKQGGILLIHEITPTLYTIFEKFQGNRKRMIYQKIRNRIF